MQSSLTIYRNYLLTGRHQTGLRSLMICPKDWSALSNLHSQCDFTLYLALVVLVYSCEPQDMKTTLDIRPMKVDEDPGFDIQLYPAYWEYSAKPNK